MRRSTTIRLVIAGTAISGMLGSGLLAATSDSVSSTGNVVTSSQYTGPVPAAHNIQVGRVAFNATSCSAATYTDGPTTIFQTRTVDGDDPGSASGQGYDDLCLKNVGTLTGQVLLTLGNVLDTEIGACEPGEAAPDLGADTTCADGAAGELSSVLRVSHGSPGAGSTGTCVPGTSFVDFNAARTTPLVVATAMAPGEICRFGNFSTMLQSGLSEAQKAISQTDRVQFDLVFTLRD